MDVVKQLLRHQLVLAGAENSSLASSVATSEVTSMFLQNGTCVQIMRKEITMTNMQSKTKCRIRIIFVCYVRLQVMLCMHTHARTHARTHAHTHTHTYKHTLTHQDSNTTYAAWCINHIITRGNYCTHTHAVLAKSTSLCV